MTFTPGPYSSKSTLALRPRDGCCFAGGPGLHGRLRHRLRLHQARHPQGNTWTTTISTWGCGGDDDDDIEIDTGVCRR